MFPAGPAHHDPDCCGGLPGITTRPGRRFRRRGGPDHPTADTKPGKSPTLPGPVTPTGRSRRRDPLGSLKVAVSGWRGYPDFMKAEWIMPICAVRAPRTGPDSGSGRRGSVQREVGARCGPARLGAGPRGIDPTQVSAPVNPASRPWRRDRLGFTEIVVSWRRGHPDIMKAEWDHARMPVCPLRARRGGGSARCEPPLDRARSRKQAPPRATRPLHPGTSTIMGARPPIKGRARTASVSRSAGRAGTMLRCRASPRRRRQPSCPCRVRPGSPRRCAAPPLAPR
ncbi:hypothetical protein LAH08_05642 [Micromonospora noduli]|uniref:Uncharacterized protein n=1 Tax=Micromonospora noduli TaxID=709876 RepID=A0A328MXP1_9ACTN|nr:hypothetical protein LAH08_05642 [Micromonospora noduli]